MRHDPASGAIVIMLRSLKMHGMAQAVDGSHRTGLAGLRGRHADPVAAPEGRDRRTGGAVDRLPAQGRALPGLRDLAGFDFASSEVNEALVRQLHRCEFIDDAHNVVLVGGPGTGKTHIATALGVQADRASSQAGPVLLHRRTRQRARTGEGQGQGRADRRTACSTPISSSSTSWATCRSAPQAARCSSTC